MTYSKEIEILENWLRSIPNLDDKRYQEAQDALIRALTPSLLAIIRRERSAVFSNKSPKKKPESMGILNEAFLIFFEKAAELTDGNHAWKFLVKTAMLRVLKAKQYILRLKRACTREISPQEELPALEAGRKPLAQQRPGKRKATSSLPDQSVRLSHDSCVSLDTIQAFTAGIAPEVAYDILDFFKALSKHDRANPGAGLEKITRLLIKGHSVKDIAAQLDCSPTTVRDKRKLIFSIAKLSKTIHVQVYAHDGQNCTKTISIRPTFTAADVLDELELTQSVFLKRPHSSSTFPESERIYSNVADGGTLHAICGTTKQVTVKLPDGEEAKLTIEPQTTSERVLLGLGFQADRYQLFRIILAVPRECLGPQQGADPRIYRHVGDGDMLMIKPRGGPSRKSK
jgi:hypothetical protein